MDTKRKAFLNRAKALGLPSSIEADYLSVYKPVVEWIQNTRCEDQPFIVGVNGAQGSGKSTFCELLKHLLHADGLSTVVLSVDDLYHTRKYRLEMGKSIHPLCAIRGVPGTHDVALGLQVLKALKYQGPLDIVTIPRFDKAMDDRKPDDLSANVSNPVDVVLFEGWCVGEPPIPPYEGPYNDRESRDDSDGVWSRWSAHALNTQYQTLNEMLDALVMLKVPSMEVVRQSRWLQEKKLQNTMSLDERRASPGLMSEAEVTDYVALFERHTEHMFATVIHTCDVLIERDAHFNYTLARI